MANRQLVAYIKEQLNHRMDINALRTLLLQQGWSQQDVEDAINEAYHAARQRTHREHHTNFVAIAVTAIVLVILIAALFLIAFRDTTPDNPDNPIVVPQIPEPELSGWEACAYEEDSAAKHSCYYDLNAQDESYPCDGIPDNVERGFCYRAKEAVALERYASSRS